MRWPNEQSEQSQQSLWNVLGARNPYYAVVAQTVRSEEDVKQLKQFLDAALLKLNRRYDAVQAAAASLEIELMSARA